MIAECVFSTCGNAQQFRRGATLQIVALQECTRTQEILLIKTQQGHLRECITLIRLDAQRLAEIMLGQSDVLVLDEAAGIGPNPFRRSIMLVADPLHDVSPRCINLATLEQDNAKIILNSQKG